MKKKQRGQKTCRPHLKTLVLSYEGKVSTTIPVILCDHSRIFSLLQEYIS